MPHTPLKALNMPRTPLPLLILLLLLSSCCMLTTQSHSQPPPHSSALPHHHTHIDTPTSSAHTSIPHHAAAANDEHVHVDAVDASSPTTAPAAATAATAVDDDADAEATAVTVDIDAYPSLSSSPPSSSSSSSSSSPAPAYVRYPPAPALPSDLSSVPPSTYPFVMWFSPILSGGGYCSESLTFISSLHPHLSSSPASSRSANRLSIHQHGDSFSMSFLQGLDLPTQRILRSHIDVELDPSLSVAICHSEPGAWSLPGLPAHYQTTRCPPHNAAITIGRTMFETDRLPDGWAERLNALDFVWVPTAFHHDVFAAGGVHAQKIVIIPEAVDTDFFTPEHTTKYQYTPSSSSSSPSATAPYRFLSIFKWEERKGWPFLIEAFLREFTLDDDVELWILTSAYHTDSDFLALINAFVEEELQLDSTGLARIHVLPSGISTSEMPSVYAAADAFVLPSRGEGWGRPHVEAMSMGLPVIATLWSGPSEYMHDDNSYPLMHDGFDTIATGAFKGHQWARPSVTHLQHLMRHVVQHAQEAKQKGRKARELMVTKYCLQCVARVVLQELARFANVSRAHRKPRHQQQGWFW